MRIFRAVGAGLVGLAVLGSAVFAGASIYLQTDDITKSDTPISQDVMPPTTSTPSPTPIPTLEPYTARMHQLYGELPPRREELSFYYDRIGTLEQELMQGYTDPNIREELSWDDLMVKSNAFIRGVYVLGWAPEAYTTVDLDTMLDKIRDDFHANTVVYLATISNDGTKFIEDGASFQSLSYAVAKAKEHGLIPGIRLQINPSDAESARLGTNWRAAIGKYFDETQWAEWFANLKGIGTQYIDFAEQNDVPFMVMLDEMNTAQTRPEFALTLKDFERKYDGVMTYQPNFDHTIDLGLYISGTNSYSPARNQASARQGDRTPYDQAAAISQFVGADFEEDIGNFISSPFQQSLKTVFSGNRYSVLTETGSNNSNSAYPFGCLFPGGLVSEIPAFPNEQADYDATTATIFSYLASIGRVHGAIFYGMMGQPDEQLPCARDFKITPGSGEVLKKFFDDPFNFGIKYWHILADKGILQ
ncbi:MAG: hypothetical protein EPN86_01990 [Nanoarchaeota archaeon]|nr:MAG: hypothetical protein EPN86_01990 [Nanoarchaeota archaeon]